MDFYLNQVLNAFATMNAPLLLELLEPSKTYQDISMPLFVSKLSDNFESMKKRGNTCLELESGYCTNIDCNPELNRTTYRFSGNHTKDYMIFRFILEPSDDGKYYLIQDIFECFCFSIRQNDDEAGVHLFLRVYDDEKKDFYLNPDGQIHALIAQKAVKEMKPMKKIMHIDELKNWANTYRPTFDYFLESYDFQSFKFFSWDLFMWNFRGYEECLTLLEKWSSLALVELSREKKEVPESELIPVICEAEKILEEGGNQQLLYTLNEEEGYQIRCRSSILTGENADIFSSSFPWLLAMQKPLVQKYFALTESETIQFLESTDVMDPAASIRMLSFHLEVREKARKQGEIIPFGLGE